MLLLVSLWENLFILKTELFHFSSSTLSFNKISEDLGGKKADWKNLYVYGYSTVD